MKKIALVVLVACVLVLAFAATATANTTSTYATWNAGGVNAGSLATPHKDYQLTTEKCAVCHAVHKANPTGQMLLGDTVANACIFCHVTVGGAGNVIVYNGVSTNFTADSAYAHNTACSNCHAVHGAGTINSGIASLDAKILRTAPAGRAVQGGTGWVQVSAPGGRDEVVSAFCSACHPYFVGSYDATHAGSFGAGTYRGHTMTAATTNFASPGQTLGANQTVAYASSAYCRSCHDAGKVDQGTGVWANNFPHFTTGVRFMQAATSTVLNPTDATSATQDGVCLKCHRDGTNGIGINF